MPGRLPYSYRHSAAGSVTRKLDPSVNMWIRQSKCGSVVRRCDRSFEGVIRYPRYGCRRGSAWPFCRRNSRRNRRLTRAAAASRAASVKSDFASVTRNARRR